MKQVSLLQDLTLFLKVSEVLGTFPALFGFYSTQREQTDGKRAKRLFNLRKTVTN
ncbi:hypothetical protein SAMN02745866_04022 [Alteromonadaceae bacterium Bs31]|nr:hypothetical protein SAMN02745866_04022 [Alteromonadaceae bacterium Bs31]